LEKENGIQRNEKSDPDKQKSVGILPTEKKRKLA
jgi:hypothetical protein